MNLSELEAAVKALGIRKLEAKLLRLEGRKFFLFLRVRRLLKKVRFLKD